MNEELRSGSAILAKEIEYNAGSEEVKAFRLFLAEASGAGRYASDLGELSTYPYRDLVHEKPGSQTQ